MTDQKEPLPYAEQLRQLTKEAIFTKEDGRIYTRTPYGESELIALNESVKLSAHALYLIEVDNDFELPIYYRPLIHFVNYKSVPPFELIKDIKKKDSFLILQKKPNDPDDSWLPAIFIHAKSPDKKDYAMKTGKGDEVGATYKQLQKDGKIQNPVKK